MQKINFKNFPDLTTPLSANNLNTLQNNIENVFNGNEPAGNMIVNNIKSKNLYNYQMTTGGWINNTNVVQNSYADTYCYTNYIQVEPNTTYTLNLYDETGLGSGCLLEYDGTQSYLNIYVYERSQIITFTTSANTYFVRFTCRQDCSPQVQLEKGSSATTLTRFQGLGYRSGKNSNGEYIMFDDGALIQWGFIDKTKFLQPDSSIYTTVQGINWYRSDVATVSLPLNFIDTNYSPNITISNGSDGTRMSTIRLGIQNNSNYGVQLIGVEPFTSSGKGYTNLNGARWIAIGRWK